MKLSSRICFTTFLGYELPDKLITKKSKKMGMKKQILLGFMTPMQMANNEFNEETLKRPLNKKPIKKYIPKGLKEFFYGENSVWAMSKKVADKKARKKGYL